MTELQQCIRLCCWVRLTIAHACRKNCTWAGLSRNSESSSAMLIARMLFLRASDHWHVPKYDVPIRVAFVSPNFCRNLRMSRAHAGVSTARSLLMQSISICNAPCVPPHWFTCHHLFISSAPWNASHKLRKVCIVSYCHRFTQDSMRKFVSNMLCSNCLYNANHFEWMSLFKWKSVLEWREMFEWRNMNFVIDAEAFVYAIVFARLSLHLALNDVLSTYLLR